MSSANQNMKSLRAQRGICFSLRLCGELPTFDFALKSEEI